MARHINLFVAVGRAAASPIATFEVGVQSRELAEARCLVAQAGKLAELEKSGVAAERVKFTREYVDTAILAKDGKTPLAGEFDFPTEAQ